MSIEDLRKGKSAELLVFSELVKRGADLYIPIIDMGIDAIVRREDGTHLDIQVKSTEKGWGFTAWVPDNPQLQKRRFIIGVDMLKSKENPEVWVFPGETFVDYSIKIGAEQNGTNRRLDLDTIRKGDDKPRRALLKKYRAPKAWRKLLTGEG